jgi:hypothetical protein
VVGLNGFGKFCSDLSPGSGIPDGATASSVGEVSVFFQGGVEEEHRTEPAVFSGVLLESQPDTPTSGEPGPIRLSCTIFLPARSPCKTIGFRQVQRRRLQIVCDRVSS